MEFFFVLGLGLLAFPIIAIVALVKTISINDRLDAIEARLAALESAYRSAAPGAAPQRRRPSPAPAATHPGHSRRRGRTAARGAAGTAAAAQTHSRSAYPACTANRAGGARTRRQLRGKIRHPLDGLDRRRGAGARRHLPREILHRGRADRARPAAVLRRDARGALLSLAANGRAGKSSSRASPGFPQPTSRAS